MKTPDTINGKTPDEIKKGLECYIVDFCDERGCEKCVRNVYTRYEIGCDLPIKNALAYIQQLESRLAQVERERDAAVADCSRFPCATCSDKESGDLCNNCNVRKDTTRTNYDWRGVCEQNTKGEP